MNNFRSDRGRRDDRRSFRGRSGGSGGRREMFAAVCSNCGKDCEVPFQPTSDKPIYCSECFEKMGGADRRDSGKRSGGRDFRGRNSGGSRQSGFDGKELVKLSKTVEEMTKKLDRIISLLSPSNDQAEAKQEKVEKKVVEEEPVEVTSKKRVKNTPKQEEETPMAEEVADVEEAMEKEISE